MLKFKYIIASLLFAGAWMVQAQQTPAPSQDGSILITGATTHIGNGQVIENGAVAVDQLRTFLQDTEEDTVDEQSKAPSSVTSRTVAK